MSSPVASLADFLDRRIGRRADPPSLWPTDFGALLSHAAIVAFLVLFATGVLLSFAYQPTVETVVYQGESELYEGQTLPGAFASIITISEDMPGGLLLRRVHVAASHLLLLSLVAHLLRTLATGAFRRPRLATHLTGVALLVVTLGFAYTGEVLPFGLVVGSSLRIAEAVMYSLPFVGEQLGMLVFDGPLPSERFIFLSWFAHLFLLPPAFIALTGWHLWQVHHRRPALRSRPDVDVAITAVGRPLWPDAVARFSLMTAGLVALLLLSSVLVPWSDREFEGPFLTAEATNSVHPPWPLFFLTGGLRIVPAIEFVVFGVRVTNVLIAGVVIPSLLVGGLLLYPFIERWVLDDHAEHHRLDHPLEVPFRAGAVTFMTSVAVIFTFGGGVDVLSYWLSIPVEAVVNTFRALLIVLPLLLAALAVLAARRRRAARHRDVATASAKEGR